ncbi:uncharacterized protein BO72DRAFT_271578 [Aspergillus fijiensis CBS 313.89]|uniref:Uncharacterized protein n=1 Tax=Aspergillus fijiensis CBS 313.89 TaxID=1448319 RepID=A0A8G1RFX8_9EURO|nr:uncharacterized protein BO72DRAFT_271578 [Aspergillus fijiensis CBS 313.89]RAK72605.1 hypothetical protein BO72DRAFT_271578 [Aspergillus fijiensis CBS 313.89]
MWTSHCSRLGRDKLRTGQTSQANERWSLVCTLGGLAEAACSPQQIATTIALRNPILLSWRDYRTHSRGITFPPQYPNTAS